MIEHVESDADLLGRGDAAVGVLLDRHGRSVFRLAYALVGDVADAQDVTQDTFVLAWRKARSIRLVGESALPWLLASARFVAQDHLRAQRRRRTTAVERLDHLMPATATDIGEATDLLGAAMQALVPSDRELVELVLVDGLSYAEAGDRLGLTAAATGKRLQRARHRLRTLIRSERSTEGA